MNRKIIFPPIEFITCILKNLIKPCLSQWKVLFVNTFISINDIGVCSKILNNLN